MSPASSAESPNRSRRERLLPPPHPSIDQWLYVINTCQSPTLTVTWACDHFIDKRVECQPSSLIQQPDTDMPVKIPSNAWLFPVNCHERLRSIELGVNTWIRSCVPIQASKVLTVQPQG